MQAYTTSERQNDIILVHGLARTKLSMMPVKRFLHRKGYRVFNFNYPSTRHAIDSLVDRYLKPFVQTHCADSDRSIHFVTHSMGGLLVRAYLKNHQLERLGRVVMLAPPNQGSEMADWLRKSPVYKWVLGPAGQQLGTEPDSFPTKLGPVNFELGVIAGDRSVNLFNSFKIPGPDDGKVAVERTKVPGMQDFFLAHVTHTFMMSDRMVLEQIDHFLQNGQFRKRDDAERIYSRQAN
jgi:pimeloyl-ACP methyl ester carboxylesterase